jgi:cytochrome c-type biogenesis protein CcmE
MWFCIDILLVFIVIYNFNKRHLLLLAPSFIFYIANMKTGELLWLCGMGLQGALHRTSKSTPLRNLWIPSVANCHDLVVSF